jgi:hypothetical protein
MGRVRYLGDAGGKVQLLRHGSFAEFGDPRKRGQQLIQLSYPVGYRYAYQPPLTCGACGHRARDGEDLVEWKAPRRPDGYVDPVCPACLIELTTEADSRPCVIHAETLGEDKRARVTRALLKSG